MESCEPLHYRKTGDSYILGEMINNLYESATITNQTGTLSWL